MRKQIAWLRILVEGAVIVGSILLAFGVDAWWEATSERNKERSVLARVFEEVGRERSRLRGSPVQSSAASAASELVKLMERLPNGVGEVEVPDTLLGQLVSAPTHETRVPALDGLLRSGRIELVSDLQVRGQIARWERGVTNLLETETRARGFVDAHLIPALAARGDVGHVLMNQWGPIAAAPLDPHGVTRIRGDSALKALVSQRYFNAAMAVRSSEMLGVTADSLMAAIQRSSAPKG
jgi:hypothetical protein